MRLLKHYHRRINLIAGHLGKWIKVLNLEAFSIVPGVIAKGPD